jgi:transposase
MSPQKCELSISQRDRIVLLRTKGQSYRQIGKTLNLRFSTVRYVIKRHEETDITGNKHRSGRPKILPESNDKL